ncbi:MAG: hypothetical protein ACI9YO_000806 [Gammaproteobacteria bacterium]
MILDNLILSGVDAVSVCVGNECIDGEIFDFDTVKLKTNDPTIKFQDTSSSSSFPTNDWSMGITDNRAPDAEQFLIKDLSAATTVMLMQASINGSIALGSGSTAIAAAISVGSVGSERRIVNVADGVDDSDAATTEQFIAFSDSINNNFSTELASDRTALDDQLSDLQNNIDYLSSRLNAVIDQLK